MVGSKSSSSPENRIDEGNKDLLEFYQNKFEELFKRDKYKEKVDKHLKELISDRYELEAEVTRKGEKISDLQKAFVDMQLSCFEERERFLTLSDENESLKKNEEILHKNIRQLLSYTKDRDLRDRIIYILQDPKVEIHERHVEGKSAGACASSVPSDLFKEKIEQLQTRVEEFSRISKNNSEVVLEDCRIALEKAREKIVEDEQEIRKLQKNLQEKEAEIRGLKQSQADSQCTERDKISTFNLNYQRHRNQNTLQNRSTGHSQSAEQLPRTRITVPSSSRSAPTISKTLRTITSNIVDLKFSLASFTQISGQIEHLLKKIKSSETFVLAAKQPTTLAIRECAAKKDIQDLQDSIRHSTRLSYDISTIWASVSLEIAEQNMPVMQRDIQQVNGAVADITVSTAETDLLSLALARAKFFDYLVDRTISLSDLEDSDAHDHSECAADVVTLENKVKLATVSVKTATDVIERINRSIEVGERYQNKTSTGRQSDEKQTDSVQLSSSESYFKTIPEFNRFQADTVPKQMNDFNIADVRRTRSEPIGGGEVTRRIDKTLSKIRQIGSGEYAKDNELCRHLAGQIRALSERLKTLYEEFNVKNVQDNFTEYSAVTLNKLEALARQSRDTVLAAEAQISAYRSNAQVLSEKLRDTEELLRESIHECLELKRRLAQMQISAGTDQPKVDDDARQTFLRTMNFKETDKPKSADNAQQTFFRTIDLDGNETAVKRLGFSSSSSRRPEGPFECMFCKQRSSDHRLCEEKIRQLHAEIRKLNVLLKNFDKEVKNEKKISQAIKDGADKVNLDLESEKQNSQETIAALEAKNASLLDQLKVVKNRLKNMEQYRRSQIEGFQTDIKNLKTKIKGLEKQLTQAVHVYEQNQKDMELLKTVHTTAHQSKSAVSAIKRLKAKLYEIETDIKRL